MRRWLRVRAHEVQMCVMSVEYEVFGKYKEANSISEVNMGLHMKMVVGGECWWRIERR